MKRALVFALNVLAHVAVAAMFWWSAFNGMAP
jgi:hypothetical protein